LVHIRPIQWIAHFREVHKRITILLSKPQIIPDNFCFSSIFSEKGNSQTENFKWFGIMLYYFLGEIAIKQFCKLFRPSIQGVSLPMAQNSSRLPTTFHRKSGLANGWICQSNQNQPTYTNSPFLRMWHVF